MTERHRALSALLSDGPPDVPTSAASPGVLPGLVQRGFEGG